MKRLILLPAILLLWQPLAAGDSSPTAQEELRSRLPKYSPEEHAKAVAAKEAEEKAAAEAKAAAESDPDLVILPPMTVIEKTMRRMEEESMYRKGAYDKELVKRELSEFDRQFLNRFTIPFIGVSKETRARESYLTQKNAEAQERYSRLNSIVATLDEDEAREFRGVLRDTDRENSATAREAARATSAKSSTSSE
jgi:hypothetical protein